MKRWTVWFSLAICLALAPATVSAQETKSEGQGGESGALKAWEWANFALLAAGLGYVIVKNAGPAFDARGRKIRKDMVEAEEIKKDAEARAAAVEQRLARLDAEIAALQAEARQEEIAETARFRRHTSEEIAKIRARAEEEIVSAGKAARMELKRYAAELALRLAEKQIRTRINGETEDRLVRGFLKNLPAPPSSSVTAG